MITLNTPEVRSSSYSMLCQLFCSASTANTKTCLPINNCGECRKSPFNLFSATANRKNSKSLDYVRRIRAKGTNIFLSTTANRKISLFFFRLTGELEKDAPKRRKKSPQQTVSPAAKDVARPKSRVALRATSLAAAVAQNGYFDPNVAPARQHNS